MAAPATIPAASPPCHVPSPDCNARCRRRIRRPQDWPHPRRLSNNLAGVIDNLNNITGTLAHNQGALEGYITNVDGINQTADSVLKNGRVAEFGAGLRQLGSFTTLLNKLMTDLVPETGQL